MAERDCDGSEYCQAEQHIEGCFNGPPPPDDESEPEPGVEKAGRRWASVERIERSLGEC